MRQVGQVRPSSAVPHTKHFGSRATDDDVGGLGSAGRSGSGGGIRVGSGVTGTGAIGSGVLSFASPSAGDGSIGSGSSVPASSSLSRRNRRKSDIDRSEPISLH